MTLLFTATDCINELGINIGAKLGQTDNNTIFIDNWLMERQTEVLQHIASYTFASVNNLSLDRWTETALNILKTAVKYQVEYVLANQRQNTLGGLIMGSNGTIQRVSKADRLDAIIAPKAHQLLLNSQMLYTGRFTSWQ